MADETGAQEPDDPPAVFCRHLILCRTIWFTGDLDDGFSLGRLVVHLRPQDHQFPFLCPNRFFLFAQLYGTPGEYTVRAWLVPITIDEDGDEVDGDATEYGPWPLPLYGEEFVEGFAFPIHRLPFAASGVYELRLGIDEIEDWSVGERVEVRE